MGRRNYLVQVSLLLGVLIILQSPVKAAEPALESQPVYEYRLEENVMIPMRDGTRLAANIYFPKTDEPLPALVVRTPYNKDRFSGYGEYYAPRGYVVVIQDIRGRYASEGKFYNYLNDGYNDNKDGYDTIEWAGTQSWCSGNVGTMGISHMCLVQYLTAPTRPPHLKAMMPGLCPADYYGEMRYSGGALQGQTVQWEISNAAIVPSLSTPEKYRGWLSRSKREEWPDLLSLFAQPFMEWIQNAADGPYWWQFAPYRHYEEMDVPILHHGGWYDRYAMGIPRNFEGVSKHGRTEKTRRSQKLFMGPWTHMDRGPRKVGDWDFGPAAEVDINALRLRWFDYWLKGIDNGIMDEPPVSIFVMGENKWRFESEWPPASTRYTTYYFHNSSGEPVYSLNDGLLSPEPLAANQPPASYTHDPHDPLPTIGGDNYFGQGGPADQREVDKRSLTFTTEPLTEDVEVTGHPTVVLYVSSTAADTDFTAMITDVHPDGTSIILRNNILRAKYRDSSDTPVLLEPGKIYRVEIKMAAFSNLFKKGHAIRVSIASSNFPKWIPNPGTGLDFGKGTQSRSAQNTIYHDAEHPSHVVLPIIPRSRALASVQTH